MKQDMGETLCGQEGWARASPRLLPTAEPARAVSSLRAAILSQRVIPDRRPLSHSRRGIKLIINHDHLALVLRVKQELEDAA